MGNSLEERPMTGETPLGYAELSQEAQQQAIEQREEK